MFMNKSGTPKRNKDRPTIKVSSINTGYVKQWIRKDQSYADWVNDAIEAKHRENEREKKTSEYKKMLDSVAFHKIAELKKDIDELKSNTNRLEVNLSVYKKEELNRIAGQKRFEKKTEALFKKWTQAKKRNKK